MRVHTRTLGWQCCRQAATPLAHRIASGATVRTVARAQEHNWARCQRMRWPQPCVTALSRATGRRVSQCTHAPAGSSPRAAKCRAFHAGLTAGSDAGGAAACGGEFTTLPHIDVSPLLTPGAAPVCSVVTCAGRSGGKGGLAGDVARRACVARLRDVCHNVGFFYAVNHGVPASLTSAVMQHSAAFFALPDADKQRLHITRSPHYRGYSGVGAEHTNGQPDRKEALDLGLERAPAPAETVAAAPYQVLHGPNQWPDEDRVPGFRRCMLEYMCHMRRLCRAVVGALAEGLGLPPSAIDPMLQPDPYAMLRLLRYPLPTGEGGGSPQASSGGEGGGSPQASSGGGGGGEAQVGLLGSHTDFGFVSVLLQDTCGGLQVLNADGAWVDAPAVPGALIVNLGDMMQLWSDNYFLATPHRVLRSTAYVCSAATRSDAGGVTAGEARPRAVAPARYSAPFFFEPRLAACVAPVQLPPVRARERDAAAARQARQLATASALDGGAHRDATGTGAPGGDIDQGVPGFESQASDVPHAHARRRMRPTEPVTYGDHMLRAFQRSFPARGTSLSSVPT